MSRLSAAQVIALGEYLEPDFDPATLTISQLLGILGFHNIVYPTPYSKPKLVQLFNDEVKRRASKFKKERLKKENSIASDDGITDGLTGEPLSKRKTTAVRRSSRRLSKALEEEEQDPSPPRPEPPKRRRSSAAPRLGGPSKQVPPPIEPTVQEESEPEDEGLPIRKIGRTKKTADVAVANRRVSQPEDSGWEDNNIFQSGAESSSPARPSPVKVKARRSSAAPRKSRKSMSAPPSSPSRNEHQPPPLSPPQFKFEPELPAFPKFRTPTSSKKSGGEKPPNISPSPPKLVQESVVVQDSPPPEEPVTEPLEALDEESEEEAVPEGEEAAIEGNHGPDMNQVIAVQKRIAEGGHVITPPAIDDALIDEVKPVPLFLRLIYFLVLSALSYAVYEYKAESASIGYCDPGSSTNTALEHLRTTRAAVEACNTENRTVLHEGDVNSPPCPLPSLWPIAALPDSCTPCPEHAICSGHAIACEKPYILKPPLLLSFLPPVTDPTAINLSTSLKPEEMAWKVLSQITDGLPGFGSVGIVPSCEEDPRRKKHIGALGKAIELALAQERGTRLCFGDRERSVKEEDGGEARRWGLPLSDLRARFRPSGDASHTSPNFDDIFQEAVQQLVQWGGMLLSEDSKGETYLAHRSPMMTWDCQLKVKSREVWAEWQMTVFGIFALIALYYTSRYRRTRQKAERSRVASLVQVALETLRHQETVHHIDPVSAPQPYLSSLQLRDLVLQEEHSVSMRARLWEKVEKVVEGNANVRTNMEEVSGGDEMRVWRWVGATGGPVTPMKLDYGTSGYEEHVQDESLHR
ncbi:hypothetical protein Moror_6517 [Moniliophthora roreri MCA 2997]|uniref:Man1/Src1 C-terminal domain-containing protein n=1 Tax=Moniliophthora roreri (strain MCA 2997) TaxID=1381753 RepID=V2YZ01_MONRO|nr:hypothetical protein Moror_6517 [Moniliophthora roreri MCA 2997]